MGRALAVDLRERVMAAVDGGMSCRVAAARFGVGVSSAIRWRQQRRVKGDLWPGRPGGNVRSSAIDVDPVPQNVSGLDERNLAKSKLL